MVYGFNDNKEKVEFKQVIYELNGSTATCNCTYAEIKKMIENGINYSVSIKSGSGYYPAYDFTSAGNISLHANVGNTKYFISHSSANNITVASDTSDIKHLMDKEWKWVALENGAAQIPFSDNAASTMLILTMNNNAASLNNLYVIRKTMITQDNPNPNAWRIGGAASAASENLSVNGQYGDPSFVSVFCSDGNPIVFYQWLS